MFMVTPEMFYKAQNGFMMIGVDQLDLKLLQEYCVDYGSIPYEKINIPINSALTLMILIQVCNGRGGFKSSRGGREFI